MPFGLSFAAAGFSESEIPSGEPGHSSSGLGGLGLGGVGDAIGLDSSGDESAIIAARIDAEDSRSDGSIAHDDDDDRDIEKAGL